jgi:hypothetical protein
MRTRRWLTLALLVVSTAATAKVPGRLAYQGRLLKSDGSPEVGSKSFTFSLYPTETGGTTPLWAETQILGLSDGYYATFLGATRAFGADLFDSSTLYLELAVDGVALSPRQEVATVPYALLAGGVSGGVVDAAEIKVGHTTVIDSAGKLASTAIAKAGAATDGYLSAADWNAFNKKLALDANNRLTLADSSPMNPSSLDLTSASLEYPYFYTLTVAGTGDLFFPVAMMNTPTGGVPGKFVISRGYWDTAPYPVAPQFGGYDASHLGGLQAVFTTSGSGWADYSYVVLQSLRQTYVRSIADCGILPTAGDGRALWCRLRGGYSYRVWANYPLSPKQVNPKSEAYYSTNGTTTYQFFYPDTVAVSSLPANALDSQAAVVPAQIFP